MAEIDATLKIEETVALVAQWLDNTQRTETRNERRQSKRLSALIADPEGVAFTMDFVDRVARHRDNKAAANQLSRLARERKLPSFLNFFDKTMLQVGARIAPFLPNFVMPLARFRMRSLIGHLVVDAENEPMHKHLNSRKAQGYACNVNLLGEAVLGEAEAEKRFKQTLALVSDPEVDYVSVKVSSITSQINLWAFDHTLQRIEERLRILFSHAASTTPPTFVNLDMEEYRDLELTIRAFMKLLDEPQLSSLNAGIVLQAYLPDTFPALQRLTPWANERKKVGGGEIKIRLVKGANLAMEKVDAALHEWNQAPYETKAEVDANYKRCLDWVLRPEHMEGVRIGLASHNLFDVAWTHLLTQERNVSDRVEFEMLQGMAPAQARQVYADTLGLLLYTPIVGRADFDVAISYLFRRLEENASEDNFLRHLFTLKSDSQEFLNQVKQFRHAVATRWEVSSTPRRHEIKNLNKAKDFFNHPDTDPSLETTQDWIKSIHGRAPQKIKTQITTSVEDIQRFVAEAKDAQSKWIQIPAAERQDVLRQVAEEILNRKDDLFITMAHEAGKTWTEIDAEINEAADFARWYAERSAELSQVKYAEFTPLGVMAVVPPWNFPTAIPTGGVLASLAAGNGVIFKPAPETPRCAEIIAEACWSAGIPKNLLQFVRTHDDDVGKHLITSVDGVILTGSVETADLFRSWKPDMFLSAETSGKNALIVTPQADLDLAAADLVRSAFGHQGQKCSAASLGILVGSVATDERFIRQIVDAAKSLIVGHSSKPETTFGPLIAPASGKLLQALTTLEEGEYWLLEPHQIDSTGQLWTPGIKAGVQPGSSFHHTECFGPVLGLMAASNLDQALEWQNAVDYGLTGGIHSLDLTEIENWLDKVQVGNAYINRHITGAIVNRQPFGGWKRSTVGSGAKAGGPDYLLQLGNWSPTGLIDLDAAQDDDDYWWNNHYNIDQDPSRLFCEANILRYKPQPNLIVRISSDAKEKEVERVLSAIRHFGIVCEVSREEEISNNDFAASLSSYRFGRIRLLGSTTEDVRAAAIQAEVHLVDEPVTSSGRLELRWYVREQAISWTLHRFGNLVNAATN